VRHRFLALFLGLLVACGGSDEATPAGPGEQPDSSDDLPLIVGQWTTRGTDDVFGEVNVLLDLRTDGSLQLTMTQVDGALSVSFPGTWDLEGDRLRLQGTRFDDGEVTVRAEITDERLVLVSDDGSTETWQRRV
jgi:uncharacterized protein (TIGR03066 family)